MQNRSSLFKNIVDSGNYIVQSKLRIGDKEYSEDNDLLFSLSSYHPLFSGNAPTVGGAVSAELDAIIIAKGKDIPRMAMLEPFIRVTDGIRISEWLPKGKFFIDTRSEDPATGKLTIHGYDAMLKAEQYFTAADVSSWGNKTDAQAVSLIASRIGVTVDSRTALDKRYVIPAPIVGDGAQTMRQMLKDIAAAYGGNWIITYDNKLLLVRLGDLPPESFYLVNENGYYITFGGERVNVG